MKQTAKIMNSNKKIKVGIVGVTGYTGQVLLSLLAKHPNVQIHFLGSNASSGQLIQQTLPQFNHLASLPVLQKAEDINYAELDCIFTATPNGFAGKLAEEIIDSKVKLIDLSADLRFKDAQTYDEWYSPLKAPKAKVLESAVYGLPEFNRERIQQAQILANPGCYPTASALGILPLLQDALVTTEDIIIDAKSGTTGAGKKAEESLLFSEITESFSAYKVNKHRHTPEIEQSLQSFSKSENSSRIFVRFTPHLLPIKRGILCTIYLKPVKASLDSIKASFHKHYANKQFVKYVDETPATKHVYASNRCHINASLDERTGILIVTSAIDNLMKGAAGQAVQNFNLMFGLDESLGLI
jgi:N-acetyl-gamma-glutamyl-phosphate reductase